jgi:5'-3' exonuclease
MLNIAIDGTAPIAKQNQQRERRFQSKPSDDGFSSTEITPGTDFMHDLILYMQLQIMKRVANVTHPWHNLKVYFSPATTPGEGEHKCLVLARLMNEQYPNERHCFFGPDADLIILSLSSFIPKMTLLREDQFNMGYYYLTVMDSIPRELSSLFVLRDTLTDEAIKNIVSAFVFMGFFVGNDFIPRINMFYTLKQGLDDSVDSMRRLIDTSNYNAADAFPLWNEKLIVPNLVRWIELYAKKEHGLLESQGNMPDPEDTTFINHTLKSAMSNGKLDYGKYKTLYYAKDNIHTQEEIKRMCLDYIKTLYWISLYYIDRIPSWTWSYKYHYAPLMVDLYETLKNIDDVDLKYITTYELNSPSAPYQQLLSVLPPRYTHYLPKEYGILMTSDTSPLVKSGMYPSEYGMDCEGKQKQHECISLLPFTDYELIKSEYDRVYMQSKKKKSGKRSKINSLTDFNYLYDYNSEYDEVMYKNKFGSTEGQIKRVEVPFTTDRRKL